MNTDNTGAPLPRIGSRWVSKDPRDQGRRVTVIEVKGNSHAVVKGAIRSTVRLPLTRLYRPLGEGSA